VRTDSAQLAFIGYKGFSYVVFDAFFSQGVMVSAYCDDEVNEKNPFMLSWLGNVNDEATIKKLESYRYFVCEENNVLRQKFSEYLMKCLGEPENALHKSAVLSRSIHCGNGNMFGARCVVNSLVTAGNGVIFNTGCVVERECTIGNYVHIGSGVVVGNNVTLGDGVFLGAGSVVAPGITIGAGVQVAPGTVISKNTD
jgi:sugar O-acyltransferase (sialic acid O-acetyltransferase NeuD family)